MGSRSCLCRSVGLTLLLVLFAQRAYGQALSSINCSAFELHPPATKIIAPERTTCLECRYAENVLTRWQVELDQGFTSLTSMDTHPCDCTIVGFGNTQICFENAGNDAARNYRCIGQIPNTPASVGCAFQVQLATPPEVTVANSVLTRNPGVDAVLSVLYTPGNPPGEVTWYKDGVPVVLGGRFSVNPETRDLTISDLQPSDRGLYNITVSNIADNNSDTVQLFVNFAEIESLLYNENDMQVECVGRGWPTPVTTTITPSSSTPSTSVLNGFDQVVTSSLTLSSQAACQREYTCRVDAGGRSATQPITPCEPLTPTISEVVSGSTSSITVSWGSVGTESYVVRYRVAGSSGDYQTVLVGNSQTQVVINDLSAGEMYTFEVGAVVQGSSEPTTYSAPVTGEVQRCEANFTESIRSVSASIVGQETERTIRLTWEASTEVDVSGYRIKVTPCSELFACTPEVDGRDTTMYQFPPSICDGTRYSFFVQSMNDCGGVGPLSSLVVRMCDEINNITELKPGAETVTIKWSFDYTPRPPLVVSARSLVPNDQNQLLTRNYTVPQTLFTLESVCIGGLESETTYEVCLHATSSQSSLSGRYCDFVTTTSGVQQSDLDDCLTPNKTGTDMVNVSPTGQAGMIENWHIAIIVVGGLAIVAMVFCLVGLCFACQSSKQKVDFGSTSSLNTNSIRDGVTVTSHQRPMSPSRSCLSYHTKGHSTNWSDHVDTLRQMETDTGTHV